jgi:cation diffusion facilitator family transporter
VGGASAEKTSQRIVVVTAVLSVGLLGALAAVYLVSDSNLALSQAADSFSDVFTAIALLVSMRVAAQPPDEEHPIGHQRAEPVAALLAAMMAGVLSFEVLRGAVVDLVGGYEPDLTYSLLWVFLTKVAIKTGVAVYASRVNREARSPALGALVVDARNDVAVGLVGVVGFFAARAGNATLDAWLAIPVALWVGFAGFTLARENIGFLMGEAPENERRRELEKIAAAVDGVESVHGLVARHHGAELDVLIHAVVNPGLPLRAAHDIGHRVEARLLEEQDVCHAVVHVDVDPAADDSGEPAPRDAR